MKKTFVLTPRAARSENILNSLGEDNSIVIPMDVMDVLYEVGNRDDEDGKRSKEVIDYIKTLDFEKLVSKEGVIQQNGSTLRIVDGYYDEKVPGKGKQLKQYEKRILQVCLGLKKEGEEVVLISRNIPLKLRAQSIGIKAEEFRDELLPELKEQYQARITLEVPSELINEFMRDKCISAERVAKEADITNKHLYENMFVILKNGSQSVLSIYRDNGFHKLNHFGATPFGVHALNLGQTMMIEALMEPCDKAPLVIIKGPAGTAKTFLALACGLQQVVEEKQYKGILYTRSVQEMDDEIGFLPGGEYQKIGPYLRGLQDNLKNIMNSSKSAKDSQKDSQDDSKDDSTAKEDGRYFLETRVIIPEAINYMRGRSIVDTFIIIDEAQNLTPTIVKSIITRVGENTKIVLLGDPTQIDKRDLNVRNNGLCYASEKMKGKPGCWQITTVEKESVRSPLAKLAAEVL